MEITGKFKDALTRQANEAVRIYSRPSHELLNSKSEFNHPPLARVVVEKKNKNSFLRCGKNSQTTVIKIIGVISFKYRTDILKQLRWPILR